MFCAEACASRTSQLIFGSEDSVCFEEDTSDPWQGSALHLTQSYRLILQSELPSLIECAFEPNPSAYGSAPEHVVAGIGCNARLIIVLVFLPTIGICVDCAGGLEEEAICQM